MALQLLGSFLRLTPDNSKKDNTTNADDSITMKNKHHEMDDEDNEEHQSPAEAISAETPTVSSAAAAAAAAATPASRRSATASSTSPNIRPHRASFAVPPWTMMNAAANTQPTTTTTMNDKIKYTTSIALPRRPSTRQSSQNNNQQQHIYTRNRSLSRIFNQVPRDRPSFRQARQDLIEYYAHLALLEIADTATAPGDTTQPAAVAAMEEDVHLQQALQGCKIRRYGRVWSRLQIAALCIHIGTLHSVPDSNYSNSNNDRPSGRRNLDDSLQLPSSFMWNGLRQELAQCRKFLMRQDANANVPIQLTTIVDGGDDENMIIPEPCETLDLLLQCHVMFDVDYKEVDLLLQVQEILATFRQELLKIISRNDNPDDDDDDDDSSNITSDKKNAFNHMHDDLKAAVDGYQQSLKQVFGTVAAVSPPSPNLTTTTATTTSTLLVIPDELVNFFLPIADLYRQDEERKNISSAARARAMLEHVNKNLVLNSTSAYSHANIKQKMRALLTKWSESILDVPQLVRLHYGGVTSAVLDNDQNEDDDVSSFGAANNNDDNQESDDSDDDDDDDEDALQTQQDTQVSIEIDRGCGGHDNAAASNGVRYRKQPAKAPRNRPRQQQQQQQHELDENDPLRTQPLLTQPTEETAATKKARSETAQRNIDDDKRQDVEEGSGNRHSKPTAATAAARPDHNHDDKKDDDDDEATQDPDDDEEITTNPRQQGGVGAKASSMQQQRRHETSNRNGKKSSKSAGKRNRAAGENDLLWIDSSSDDDNNNDEGTHEMEQPTAHQKKWKPPAARKTNDSHDHHHHHRQDEHCPKRRKIVEWTDAEAKAVKEGYERFGPKWRLIRDNCNNQLSRRSNVQIKDKWRTMQKQAQRKGL